MIILRPNRPDEADRLVDVWRRAVDATHDFLTPEDRLAIDREVQAFFPLATFVVAADAQDVPVGFMLLNDAHMEALFIDPDRRGEGLGALLVAEALRRRPTLTTDVNEQNGQALGFYTRLGFRVTGRSEYDGQGRPYPLLHLRSSPSSAARVLRWRPAVAPSQT